MRSRADHERVIKLLLHQLDALADHADPNELPTNVDHDAGGNVRVTWTAAELERADRYLLDVTARPGGGVLEPTLELRLVTDTGWDPAYADDVPEDEP
jgi:hypothetical protein